MEPPAYSLSVSQHTKFTRAQPPGHNLNHFQSQLGAGSILLRRSLAGLLPFRFSVTTGRHLRFFPFAVQPDEDGYSPDLTGSEGKRDLQREDHPTVAEGKERPFRSGAQRVVMHVGTPDMAPRFARQSIVDSTGEGLGTEWQQKLEDAVAEVIEVPAGLAEEAVKRGVVFEAAQTPGLNDACEGAAAGAENPGTGQRPEGGETGRGEAGLEGEQEGSKGAEEEIRHGCAPNLS
jgi:hypothetical protein